MPRKKITPIESTISGGDLGATPALAQRPHKTAAKLASSATRASRKRTPAAAIKPPAETTPPAEQTSEEILNSAVTEHEQIALLAYSYWEARGCQGGSPDEDWHRAEHEVRTRRARDSRSRTAAEGARVRE